MDDDECDYLAACRELNKLALHICEFLPDTDFIDNLKNILFKQYAMIRRVECGEDMTEDEIEAFNIYQINFYEELNRLHDATKKIKFVI